LVKLVTHSRKIAKLWLEAYHLTRLHFGLACIFVKT